jgi:hypothetical protein
VDVATIWRQNKKNQEKAKMSNLSKIDPKDLEKACGGWSEFGAPARLQVVRLARPSQVEYGDPGVPKSEVFEMKEIPRMDDKLHLKANDIVYIPMKRVVAQ